MTRTILLGLVFLSLLSVCNGDTPGVGNTTIVLGAILSLTLRRMLTDGTWPQRLRVPDPYKSAIASLLASLTTMLVVKGQGAGWDAAIAAGLAGDTALVQGLAEALLPMAKNAVGAPRPTDAPAPPAVAAPADAVVLPPVPASASDVSVELAADPELAALHAVCYAAYQKTGTPCRGCAFCDAYLRRAHYAAKLADLAPEFPRRPADPAAEPPTAK